MCHNDAHHNIKWGPGKERGNIRENTTFLPQNCSIVIDPAEIWGDPPQEKFNIWKCLEGIHCMEVCSIPLKL